MIDKISLPIVLDNLFYSIYFYSEVLSTFVCITSNPQAPS